MDQEYQVVQAGDTITPEQGQILVSEFRIFALTHGLLQKLFGQKLAKFQIVLHCVWHNNELETFVEAAEPADAAQDGDDAGGINHRFASH